MKNFPSIYGTDVHHDLCFGCGKSNSIGLQAPFTFDEIKNQVYFKYSFNKQLMGPPNFVHGGVLSTILDEAMGVLCFHFGFSVMTDEMSFKFKKATPIETDLLISSKILHKKDKKIYVTGKVSNLDETIVYVESNGIFHSLPPKFFSKKIKYTNMDNLEEVMEINREKRSHFIKEETSGDKV